MFEEYQSRKWVIGVSGGIDSMSLLNMAYQEGLQVVVCHVNYLKRASANYDEQLVESYCRERHIPYYVRRAVEAHQNNFQAWARDFRYQFYHDIMDKEHCDGVLLAHHGDDFLETALLREKQGRCVSFYGIKEQTYVKGMLVCRPLLKFFKEDLECYLKEQKLSYGQDETNFETTYERNKIRNLELIHKSREEKQAMLAHYQSRNAELAVKQQVLKEELEAVEVLGNLPLSYLKRQKESHGVELLRAWLVNYDDCFYEVSEHFLKDVFAFVFSKKVVATKAIGEFLILKEYAYLKVIPKVESSFCYVIENIAELTTPYFKIQLTGNIKDGLTVSEEDFPLKIRSVKEGDSIAFKFGHKNIHQYFRDAKIPYEQRISWPIVENRVGEVIFVCNLGSNITHFTNKPNLFVVK